MVFFLGQVGRLLKQLRNADHRIVEQPGNAELLFDVFGQAAQLQIQRVLPGTFMLGNISPVLQGG